MSAPGLSHGLTEADEHMKPTRTLTVLVALFATLLFAAQGWAQSTTSGAITGTITDASGAVVPGATVTAVNSATNATRTATANSQGRYTISYLDPGAYTLTVSAKGFTTASAKAEVAVGLPTNVPVTLQVTGSKQVVTVTAAAPLLQTQNGNLTTTFGTVAIQNIPNPGNDITSYAQNAPGAIMNTQGGYGNFEMFGIPATSNLFTLDGADTNDPFLNLNNSGATNLLLGANEISQVAIVNNGYTGEYGRLAGANITYTTKSGGQQFHGNAKWWWNGRSMNANDFFNNASGAPRSFDNANQWAWSIGGPLLPDHKTFFFVDQEGLRVVLPTSTTAYIPSPAYQTATIANLQLNSPSQVPFYQQVFNLYNTAPGASSAIPDPNDTTGNIYQFQATPSNFTHEWLLSARVDHTFSDHDTAFFRFQTDHGTQATLTDIINPVFNAQSVQPEYQGQLHETHQFGGGAVNEAILSGQWYSAIFGPSDLAKANALVPYTIQFFDGSFSNMGGTNYIWPQGRNVTQYQLIDNFTKPIGTHELKFGGDFRREDVNDQDFGFFNTGLGLTDMTDFQNGSIPVYIQSFPQSLAQPMALYNLGLYGQDKWNAGSNLTLTLSLRIDDNSNPVCQRNCFSTWNAADFQTLNHDPNNPYNQAIKAGQHQALSNYKGLSWEPRLGFAWQPFGSQTVLRGGFGIFSDAFPASVVDNLSQNAPYDPQFVIFGANASPAASGNAMATAAGANQSFQQAFANGGTLASISASNPNFAPPSFFGPAGVINTPYYEEWNVQLQHRFGNRTVASLNYVGNHGQHELIVNPSLNAFNPGGTPLSDLPPTAPDTRFSEVQQFQTDAVSNYDGLVADVRREFSTLEVGANYTWGHALDTVSNGGLLQFNLGDTTSILNVADPLNTRAYNYGNADYDVRQQISAYWVWTAPFDRWTGGFLPQLTKGWVFSGRLFGRTGMPFSVIDGTTAANLNGNNFFGPVFANWNGQPVNCTSGSIVDKPCLSTQFSSAGSNTTYANQIRNQFFGPHYWDTDMSLVKDFKLPWESSTLGIGIQGFNIFNHPNFDLPINDVSNPQFGLSLKTVSVPTSILGSFLGGDASPRILEFNARLRF